MMFPRQSFGCMRAALVSACTASLAFGAFPANATKTLLDNKPGLVARHERERITALYGVPIETDSDPQTSTDNFVDWFIGEHADAFGVEGVHLHQIRKDFIRGNKFAVYMFEQQTSDGLPVHATIVKIPVLLGTTEKIGYVGMRLIPLPESFPPDTIETGEDALIVPAMTPYQYLTGHSTPILVAYEDAAGTVRRCWRFVKWTDGESYFFFVNAADGALIAVVNATAGLPVSGRVWGNGTDVNKPCASPPELCNSAPSDWHRNRADSEENPPVLMALPGVEVSLYYEPNASCGSTGGTLVEQTYTNVDWTFDYPEFLLNPEDLVGYYTFNNVQGYAPENLKVRARLAWPLGEVINAHPSGNLTACNDNIVDEVPVELTLNPVPQGGWMYPHMDLECNDFDNMCTDPDCGPLHPKLTAEINALLALQATHDYLVEKQPAFGDLLDTPLIANVNYIPSAFCQMCRSCADAYRDPPQIDFPRCLFDGATARCKSPAMTTVAGHEYAHIVIARLLEATYEIGGDFDEGMADAISAFVWRTPLIGQEVQSDYNPIQNIEAPNVMLPCSGTPYICGSAIAGALWDMRSKLILEHEDGPLAGLNLANDLFVDFLFVTDGWFDETLLLEMLVVDDDDADLTTTPMTDHSEQILAAFNDHGFQYHPGTNDGSVIVNWEGVPGTQPQSPADFSVAYNFEPPVVTLKSTQGGNPAQPVTAYTIGRIDPTSPPGEPIAWDLGAVRAEWDSLSNNDIIVRVGTDAVGAPVRNLDSLEIEPQSVEKWTSIELILAGDLLMRANAYRAEVTTCIGGVNEPQSCDEPADCPGGSCAHRGGRISGTIQGNAQRITAQGIGLGGTQAGTLTVLGTTLELALGEIGQGSVVDLNVAERHVSIVEPVAGTVNIKTLRYGENTYIETARLDLMGGGTGTIIVGDASGGGLEGAAITIGDNFDGILKVQKVVRVDGVADPRIQTPSLSGTIEIVDATAPLEGFIDIGSMTEPGHVAASGLLDVKSPLASGAAVTVWGDVAVDGTVRLKAGVAANSNATIKGDVAGRLEIGSRTEGIVGDVLGDVSVDGTVSGVIDHNGRVMDPGGISLGELAANSYYTQNLIATPAPTEPWSGSLTISGDLDGDVGFHTALDGANIVVNGAFAGELATAQVYNSTIALNVNGCGTSTSGLVTFGRTGMIWQTDAQGAVDIGRIDVYEEFLPAARIDFYGCYQGTPITSIGTVCIHDSGGGLVRSLICKKPPVVFCPPEQYIDPCSQ